MKALARAPGRFGRHRVRIQSVLREFRPRYPSTDGLTGFSSPSPVSAVSIYLTILQNHLINDLPTRDASPSQKVLVGTVKSLIDHHTTTAMTPHTKLLKKVLSYPNSKYLISYDSFVKSFASWATTFQGEFSAGYCIPSIRESTRLGHEA